MIRAVALPVTFLTSALIALAADQPNNSDEPGEFDVEPPILKQNLSDELAETGTPDGDVARCEKKLERSKRNAEGAERLWKIGVLAKVEVEQRALKMIKCETELASARVAAFLGFEQALRSGTSSGKRGSNQSRRACRTTRISAMRSLGWVVRPSESMIRMPPCRRVHQG